jgi:rubrerythrin
MEISERRLRRMATEVDERHRDGMATMAQDAAELHAETRRFRAGRRSFLRRAGIGAGAFAIGTSLLTVADLVPVSAQEKKKEEKEVTDEDIAAFAESVELAAVKAYEAAAATGKLQPAVLDVATLFAGHHAEHARSFAAFAPTEATGKANAKLVTTIADQLKGAKDQAAVLALAYDIEQAAVATYMSALGALKDADARALTASILPVESQHAVVLGAAMGKTLKDYVPSFESQAKALDPVKFPIA